MNKKGMGCLSCFKSSREPKKSWKCWKGKLSKEETSRKRKRKGSKDEESSKNKGSKGCFICKRSSNDKELSRKKGECGICCIGGTKSSSEELLKQKGKGHKLLKCCVCAKSSERKGCFSCFKSSKKKESRKRGEKAMAKSSEGIADSTKHRSTAEEILRIGNGNIAARVFTYREIAAATQDFAPECLLGKGGFGKVYKGLLMETEQTVAIKQLDRSGCQGNREFLVEVLMLSLLSHPNLVNLLGYCADGDERILVYDYMPLGSLEDHLFDLSPDSKPLDWNTRMKIALGAARGLEHLHVAANPPVIYRDLKASNILLDHDFNPRLADFGLAKLGPVGAKNHVSTRVVGTFGYSAPEYVLTGKLTKMSDIYSFGVVLLELITGRKAMDPTRPLNEQRLVDWATPLFNDKRNFMQMADPLLEGNFPVKPLYQALAIAAMCIQVSDSTRPFIKDVTSALHFLTIPNSNYPSEEVPENSIPEDELPPEQQIEVNDCVTTNDEDSPHSTEGDWQSCSTEGEDEEELEHEADIT